ncbi:heparinase II/III family protein [Phyllobacterium leguminum]|uniref:Putative heparinase superfamily protein n=1 Tax=Phyllobacterium leguminum TaxID=314237 RepID=A0A318TFK9_9HYPH|nr:heparinase II/III family protein [Phyllobacterium leguminum]PYE87295.1 putative heparinase superfamily protein [Phyllobacterium leguminum]
MNVGRLARTVIHLQPGQIINRLVRRPPRLSGIAGAALACREAAGRWTIHAPHPASMLSETRFRFLAEERELDGAAGWNDPSASRLWIYNLHYFDDLLSPATDEKKLWHRELIERWIRENPPLKGAGWEPYPLSRRTVNWIVSALSGAPLPAGFLESLTIQGKVLRRSLEYHLRGNHLFVNAKALIFLGCFFDGPEAEEWLRCGLRIMAREANEQILADGGHFERSPMYHALLLEDMLDLVQLSRLFPSLLESYQADWCNKAAQMLDWLATMSHPDGEIGLFNDAAFHEARNLAALSKYGEELGLDVPKSRPSQAWLRDSGYIRLADGAWTALFDVAPVGPDYIPGHAHADTLSFELSLGVERIVTNGGTSTYENSPLRWAERATSSHATVEIDGKSSSEVWGSFRVGRRARPAGVTYSADATEAQASHDGYRFLTGKPVHERRVCVTGRLVRVTDTISSLGKHNAVARFPLHPSVDVEQRTDGGWLLRIGSGEIIAVRVEGAVDCDVVDGHFAPEFGIRLPRKVLTWQMSTPSLSVATIFEHVSK